MDPEPKAKLQAENRAAWCEEPVESRSLDSSLKKNTAFVKKLKTSLTATASASILKEIASLSLTKYQSELLLGTQEGLLKCTKSFDVVAASQIVSALHQRFPSTFTRPLLQWFLLQLENPKTPLSEKEEKERVIKVKILLRLLVEFVDLEIFPSNGQKIDDPPTYIQTRTEKGDSLIVCVLKEVLGYKVSSGNGLTVATSFAKRFSVFIEENSEVNSVLKSFTEAIIARTEQMYKKLKDLSKKKFKAQIRTGRVLEDLETEYDELSSLFEVFYAASVYLGDFFDLKTFEYKPEDLSYKPEGEAVVIAKDTSLWSNDEERRFYEQLIEIPEEMTEDMDKESRSKEMTDFLIKLETSTTNKEIDETVLEFWALKLNNKASRNRLVKHFTSSKDVGMAKVYARFLKINEKYLSEVTDEVLAYLDQGFRSQIYHNGLNFRNIVFFCELIKFKLIPEHVTFHKIRSLILNLTTPNNIEILSIFFEFSGKFLLHEHERLMDEMLILLESKRKNDKLTINNKMAINNLFLLLKPPSIKSLQAKKQLTPEQAFIKTLIRKELNLTNDNDIRRILCKLDLTQPEIFETVMSVFTKPDKINYDFIPALSNILKNMPSAFKILVLDAILENITRGMEVNDYKSKRVRLAQIKYIAEIYERKIIGVAVLHDLTYQILTFGYPQNQPTPQRLNELDLPDDYFRISMVCLLLGDVNFRKETYRSKLNTLLMFFDYYILIKDHPIPKDTEFKMIRVFEKYSFQRADGIRHAVERLAEAANTRNNTPGEDDDDDDDDDDEDEDEDEEQDEDIGDVDNLIKPINSMTIESNGREKVDERSEDEVVAKLTYEAYERKLQEEEEKKLEDRLEKEFKRLVSESMNSQKNSVSKPAFGLPQMNDMEKETQEQLKKIVPGTKGTIPFTLVTKKGKSIATKSLSLPSNVKFAHTVVEEERKQREEKKQINKFILSAKFDDD